MGQGAPQIRSSHTFPSKNFFLQKTRKTIRVYPYSFVLFVPLVPLVPLKFFFFFFF